MEGLTYEEFLSEQAFEDAQEQLWCSDWPLPILPKAITDNVELSACIVAYLKPSKIDSLHQPDKEHWSKICKLGFRMQVEHRTRNGGWFCYY